MAIKNYELDSISGLQNLGFRGFKSVGYLRSEGLDEIPAKAGVYLLIRNDTSPPVFLKNGTGGHYKDKNPNVTIDRLNKEWVKNALIVYIGQAGSGSESTLTQRIREMIKFGEGSRVGHWGGRLVWQSQDAKKLLICWKSVENDAPRTIEKNLIGAFKYRYSGMRPFANLQD